MSEQEPAPFVAGCPDCGERKEAGTPNEVIEFYRRHRALTGHDVEWEYADYGSAGEPPDDADLKSVVLELGERFEDGVPLGLVTAAMGERGRTVGETLDELRELRMTGHVWEPKDDHVSAF
ncbi:hypothetical protein A4G99_19790 [Haladaptatus sp. R4]|uniref:hypothetical protein n=1 Tax=Haladaptatus sp. R4 TaxID=1679489 RepID=UPI0007B4875D|nr:hypothetical protein [Haladaptatus sp. R4]KZN22459.1 hypothetical protein A4G99_19790 [Haladaptatus sp. R4]